MLFFGGILKLLKKYRTCGGFNGRFQNLAVMDGMYRFYMSRDSIRLKRILDMIIRKIVLWMYPNLHLSLCGLSRFLLSLRTTGAFYYKAILTKL
jgi:hypothetical protein